jgi:hypothetical protein
VFYLGLLERRVPILPNSVNASVAVQGLQPAPPEQGAFVLELVDGDAANATASNGGGGGGGGGGGTVTVNLEQHGRVRCRIPRKYGLAAHGTVVKVQEHGVSGDPSAGVTLEYHDEGDAPGAQVLAGTYNWCRYRCQYRCRYRCRYWCRYWHW